MRDSSFVEVEIVGEIDLTLQVEKDGDQFASTCVELGTVSCGDTFVEAVYNICDAVYVHLNALERVGQRTKVFQEKGINIRQPTPTANSSGNEIAIPLRLPAMPGVGDAESSTPDPEEWIAKGFSGRQATFPVYA